MRKIVLVGMPGSGKSTLGKRLAKLLQFSFYDLDREIETSEGKRISEIFATQGEGYFRKLETSVLEGVLSRDESFVLSTGGGAPCFNKNMDLINEKAISAYLDVPLEEILVRLTGGQINKRPLFAGLDSGEIILKLRNMHSERHPYYDMAKVKLSGEDISAELLVSEWLGLLKIESKR